MVDRDISNGPGTGSGTVDAGLVEFLRTLNDGVTVIGSDRRLKFFNQSYLDLFMLGDGEISLGDESEDVLRALARRGMLGDLGGQSAEDVAAERAAKLGTDESRVERRSTLDGRIIDIYRSPTRQGDIVSIHVDVTETVRNAEEIERQRLYMVSLLENTTDGIALLDRDGRFVMFNNRFLELYDIDPGQVFWGIDYHQFMQHFGDLKGLAEDDREAELESRYHFAFDPYATQIRRRLRNGRTLNINKTVLPGGGCVMTYRDITADLVREEELIRARFVAEESSRHRSEFVARMSHEMRTPLNGILGVTALLQRQELGERTTELLGVIRASGTVLLRLIDDILDLSKLEAETFEMVSDDFDLTDVVEECIALIEPGAEEKGLDVHVLWPRSRIPKLFGDMVRIKQILLNLLTNAVKFTDQGQIVVTLDGAWAPDGVAVTLAVSDTGVGIAEDRLEPIFAEFYQIDGTATRKYGGAGLGLSITKKLLDLIGGKIEVESEPGVGSTFRVGLTLPKAGRISQAS